MHTLLVVDDHELVLDALCAILEREGFVVVPANTGEIGIEIAITLKPDLIITDYHMPITNGLDVLRAVRRHPAIADIPVLILTQEENTETRKLFTEHGANAVVTKSQRSDELISAVHQLLS